MLLFLVPFTASTLCADMEIPCPDAHRALRNPAALQTVGTTERIRLAGLALEAKVDTGAQTSSMHATEISVSKEDGKRVARFKTVEDKVLSAPVSRRVDVKSSNGTSSVRTFVVLPMRIGGKEYDVEFSLSDRSTMKYPVLLGAGFLRGRFLVDVARDQLQPSDN